MIIILQDLMTYKHRIQARGHALIPDIRFLKRIEKKTDEVSVDEGLVEVDHAISAMWALRHELLEKVGLFDERFFLFMSDHVFDPNILKRIRKTDLNGVK